MYDDNGQEIIELLGELIEREQKNTVRLIQIQATQRQILQIIQPPAPVTATSLVAIFGSPQPKN